ncbi:glucosamine-6-phosphate deaminase [Pontibacillus sp. HMF3514]|uniref:glucosamine-6-phosphate deaminase n=1 Tax=Pontibacillus sp. HMF3514 TaxID=2692425 RepID=UPI00131FAF87|nr:glucosamine-6-phosphate deaminase [Pontibacillus sp. HMF3514]QHE53022.1 glucosamine-6-phosphate deaminase [Pontibacillus sp. HMF3514]
MTIHSAPIKTEQVDQLNVKVYENRTTMGVAAAREVSKKIKELLSKQNQVRMIFAAAPSQNEFLEHLRSDHEIDWSRITAFHMDEYIGLPIDAPQRFSHFLSEHLFNFVNLGEVHLMESSNHDKDECKRYTELINQAPIDIVCLGIGENGHIAFNDPPVADFNDSSIMKSVELDEVCRQQQVNDGCFQDIQSVPTHALTLTIPTLLSGKYLYCIVPGPSKRVAVEQTINGSITTECPASILRSHSACTLYLDADSYEERV